VSIGAISMGQEIGISAVQLGAMVSSIANDGIWVAPRIVAGQIEPQNTPQTIAFHPANEHRVISPLTAAQMRKMLEEVVLHGTGRKALLEGYTSAGKTGTAQKVDPATGAYSRSKYVASFAGFAPINNPAITVAVILDSAQGLHQGGQIAAPVFQRIAQHVLEYLHTPHDVELPASRQVLLARQHVTNDELDESSPDHLGGSLEVADATPASANLPLPAVKPSPTIAAQVIHASMKEKETSAPMSSSKTPLSSEPAPDEVSAKNGTVVLDVEQGGIEVPSFMGKSVRSAIETAQDSGLELDAIGSGLAREQSPPAGSHVAAGARIVVRFAR
jgi:cell division protein FtsI (penicillin-binding protein 3)